MNDEANDANKPCENKYVNGNEDSGELDDKYSSETTVIFEIPTIKAICDVVNSKKSKKKNSKRIKKKKTGLSIKTFALKKRATPVYKLKCKLCGKVSKLHRAASLHIETVHKRHITLLAMFA